MCVCQCGRSIGIGLLCWYGTVHERGGQCWMSWRACAHCHRECHYCSMSCSMVCLASVVRSNGQGGAIYVQEHASIDIQHSSFVGNSAVCLHLTFGCLSCALSQSHIAKGPEIEPRHRLVHAVGIMRCRWPSAARTVVELLLHWWH